jgi:hypothetical protein
MVSGMSEAFPALRVRRPGWRYGDVAFGTLVLTITGTALAAYNVGPVPVQWLAQSLVFGTVLLLGLRYLYPVPGSALFACIFAWALAVTLVNSLLRDYGSLMPQLVTSSYPIFIALRFVALLSFAATVYLVYWLLREGYRDRVVRAVVIIGTATAALALYIYVAQLYGWWEPGRTRQGTGAAEQVTTFTYAFHRAMGTFREPSHLAEWLVVPFFLGFLVSGRLRHVSMIVIGGALLLTGSLTGIMGAVAGLGAAMVLTNPFRRGQLKVMLQAVLVGAVAVVVFNLFAAGYYAESKGLFGVIAERLEPILWGEGMAASNRSYVYTYISDEPLRVVGVGLGHSNIEFSAHHGFSLMGSFVSLYFNYLQAVGVVGLGLMLIYLGFPVVRAVGLPGKRKNRDLTILLAAYVAWLVMFAVHAEEPGIMFGVAFALLVYETGARRGPDREEA